MRECYIIRSGSADLYLMAMAYPDTGVIRWSGSKYDAVRIYSLPAARKLAKKVIGKVYGFDSKTGSVTRKE